MQSIRTWLLGKKDYAVGVALYATYGEDNALKAVFAQGQSAYRAERLEKVLRELVKGARSVEVELPAEKKEGANLYEQPVKVKVETAPSKHDLPENRVKPEDDPYRDQWMKPYKEMMALCHQLKHAPTEEERGVMAFEILRLERECMSWWDKREYYLKYKEHIAEEKTEEVEAVVDTNALMKLLLNARCCLSKARGKLKANPLDHNAKARVEKYEATVADLERRLGKDG